METNQLLDALSAIFGGISRSRLFWDMQQNMRGERFLLSYLYAVGSCAQGALAPMLHVSAARITKMLSSLESKALIVREDDPTDKRRAMVRLTEDGADVVRTVQSQATAHASQLFESLGEQDTLEFLRIVNKILSIEEMVDEPTAD